MSFLVTDRRQLGCSGIQVSPLGLGTVKFGRNTDVKYPRTFDIPDQSQLDTLLATAGELGINLLDTAPAYGDSEEKIGRLLQGKRQQWIIATKVGERYADNQSSFDFSARSIQHSVESSLFRLCTDYLDIVLIHCSEDDEMILRQSDAIGELLRLRDKGTIRCIGASTKSVAGGLVALESLDLIMVTYNREDNSQQQLLQVAGQKKKGVIVKKALASGHAVDVKGNIEFVLNGETVSTAIIGTINPDHLRQNVGYAISAIRKQDH